MNIEQPFRRHPQAEKDLQRLRDEGGYSGVGDMDSLGRTIENQDLHKQQREIAEKLREKMVALDAKILQLKDRELLEDARTKLVLLRDLLNTSNPQVDRFQELKHAELLVSDVESIIAYEPAKLERERLKKDFQSVEMDEIDKALGVLDEAA